MLENPWHVYMDVFFHTVLLSIVFCLKPKTPGLNMVKPFWGPTNFKWIKSNTEKWPSAIASYFHHLNTFTVLQVMISCISCESCEWIRMTPPTHFQVDQVDQVLIKQGMLITFWGSSSSFFPPKKIMSTSPVGSFRFLDQDLPSPVKRKSSPWALGGRWSLRDRSGWRGGDIPTSPVPIPMSWVPRGRSGAPQLGQKWGGCSKQKGTERRFTLTGKGTGLGPPVVMWTLVNKSRSNYSYKYHKP